MKKITSFTLFFIVVFLVAGGKLEAQIKKGFQPRFSEAVKGNVTLIANNVLSRNKTTSYIGSDGNHDFSNNVFVDIDSDASTFNSSSANLSNPEPTVSCLSIKKAYLYWAAADKEEDNSSDEPNWDYNKVKLQLPGSLGYTTITADDVIYRGRDEIGHFVNDPYICFKDITSEVKALATPYGTYQVANVRAKEGSLTSHGGGNTGTSGGWQIVFVYESPTLPAKNISLFDGYAHVTSSVNNFEIGFSGFQTVPTGDVDVDVVIGALEGDRDLSGDRLQIKNTSNNWVDLSYSLRNSSNFFNSRIAKNGSNFIDRNPASTNTLGFDADVFALSNPGNSIIANNQTSATIRLTSNQETYGLFLIGLSVDVWKPDLAPLILSSSTNTSSVEDTVSFSVNIENNGNDNVKDLTIETTIPQEVDLIEPIIGLPFGVTYSYNTTTRLLTFDAIDGITDVGGTPYSLSFQVKVKEQCYFLEEMCSDKFQMQLIATYAGEENNSTQTTLSSKSVDSCGIGDNLPNEISINQPDEANWTTTVDSLDRTVSCEDSAALATAQLLTPEASCDLTITKIPGSFEASTTNCPVIGTYTNIWTFTDSCGRTSGQFTQTITVTDTSAPVLSAAPADVSVDCEAIPSVPTITAIDNCDSVVDVVFTEVSNTVVDGCGEIVRQWESTDNCGNTVSHTQTITVTDTIAPVLSAAPADVSVDCEAIPTVPTITATDNCDSVVDVVFTEVSNTVVDGCGEIVRQWESIDNCGNTVSHTQTITVTDTTAPVLSARPADVSVDCEAIPAVPTITATDNCDSVVDVVFTEVSNTVVDGCGEIVRQWESTDNCGNTVSHTQTITVTDTTAPVLSATPADVSVDCEAIPSVPTITATDNCDSVVDVVFTEVSNTVVDGCGEIVRQWESTDNCGNTVSHTQTITVTDTTAPVLSATPADVSVDCEAIPSVPTITATDNCDSVVDVVFTEVSNTVVDGCGEIVRQWESTDNCGNTVSHTQTITVTDTTAPVLSATPADVSVDCEAIPVVPTITVTDNCDSVVDVVFTEVSNTVVDGCGEIVRQWESTDNCGNTVSHTQTITVTDTTAPVLSATPADVSVDCEAIPVVPTITVTDNCDSVVDVVFTEVSNTVVDGCGEIVRQWESTDNCGNTVSHTQTITVTDTTAPVLSATPADVSVDCEAIPVVSTITATDNCDSVVDVIFTEVNNTVVDGCGEIVRQWESTDKCGNTVSHTQTITVTDTTAPVLSATPADVSVDCEAIPAVPTITATDNCHSVVDVVFTEVSNTVVDGCGEIVRQWESTDNCGNTVSHTQTITVTDTTAPVLSATPADVSVDCEAIPAVPTITATDNCDSVVDVIFTEVSNTVVDGCGEIVRQWESTDNCGNTVSHTQTITVTDITKPDFTVPVDITIYKDDNCTYDASIGITGDVTNESDNCDTTLDASYSDVESAGTCEGEVIVTRTWSLTDNCGNTTEKVQTITVKDNTAPIIDETNKNNIDIECGVGDTETTLQDWLNSNAGATATDNCSTVTWTNNYGNDTSVKCDGSYITVTFTATDACGNFSTTTAGYLIKDETAPTITQQPSDKTVECDGAGNITELNNWLATNGGATATDDCSIVTWSNNYTALTYTCSFTGEVEVVFTAKDACGNTVNTTSAKFTIEDTVAPEFVETLPAAEITVSCDNIPVMETLTATDNCDASVTVIPSEVTSGDDDACGSEYLITRKWTVSDCSGNTTTHIQVITVEDTTAPEFVETLPAAEITVSCDNIPAMETLTATDNCDASVTVIPSEVTSGDDDACGSEYLITRKWTVSDCSGNTTTHIQVITVEDTVAPEFVETLPAAEITVSCDNIPVMETLTATDNCDASVTVIPSEVTSGDDDACGSEYLITRKWTVSDCSGNTTTHIQVITVEDTVAPEFVETLPAAEITVSCDNIPVMETLTATDNCDVSVTVIPSEVTSGDDDACGSEYLITRKWTVLDCSGNTTTHIQVIAVEDTVAPEFVEELPADATVSCDTIPAAAVLTATDNCDTSVTVNYSEEFSGQDDICASEYTITRTWAVQDCAGNSTSHTQVVTVEDTTAPEFVEELPADAIVSCDTIPTAVILTATDNCDASVTVNYSEEFSGQDDACASEYTVTRTWTVEDCAGNETSHTQVVTVEDTQAPEFVEELPADVTVSCDTIPTVVILTATDNCDASVTVNYSEEFSGQDNICASEYTVTRTWAVEDCAGNEASHTQVITIEDNEAPQLVSTLEDIIVECDTVPDVPTLEFTDNCSSNVTQTDFEETSTFDGSDSDYTITRTWTVTDDCGNVADFIQYITVTVKTSVTEIADSRCIDDGEINLNDYLANQSENGTWEVTQGSVTISNDGSFDPSGVSLGDYVFTYTSSNSSCLTVTEVTININDDCLVLPCGQEDVVISKAVTPNGDSWNEFFEVTGAESCGFIANVKIFNRWGARVFESKNYVNNWNGTSDGATFGSAERLPAGTYYYIVILENSGLKPFTGAIYLGTK
ncbi:gliding motility-associated C-terminal domain-containing protein [Tenacibaculum sp. XPcli2-G]|uniref:gliding motility-associated C-terminal domain-containing protein n=1 Tax=Tenacibaculum sp. XPcli2-G TaxID=2954503 RepID=UPI00209822CE|nr:gliding motility-associated C-terminal domain-containing protein [Tenacibaculum sp. XPcli2-G]MCO7185496.1 gliding motility-associated C-terminal domain-containing protein [Tenacibaculum sp. XPcli2-G]